MYFSYFRGRQYELLALKELAQKKLIGNLVIPVVEPIKMQLIVKGISEKHNKKYQIT